jgi:hypothetical protein
LYDFLVIVRPKEQQQNKEKREKKKMNNKKIFEVPHNFWMTMIPLRGGGTKKEDFAGQSSIETFFFKIKRKSFFSFGYLTCEFPVPVVPNDKLSAKLFVPPILPFNIIILLKKKSI